MLATARGALWTILCMIFMGSMCRLWCGLGSGSGRKNWKQSWQCRIHVISEDDQPNRWTSEECPIDKRTPGEDSWRKKALLTVPHSSWSKYLCNSLSDPGLQDQCKLTTKTRKDTPYIKKLTTTMLHWTSHLLAAPNVGSYLFLFSSSTSSSSSHLNNITCFQIPKWTKLSNAPEAANVDHSRLCARAQIGLIRKNRDQEPDALSTSVE